MVAAALWSVIGLLAAMTSVMVSTVVVEGRRGRRQLHETEGRLSGRIGRVEARIDRVESRIDRVESRIDRVDLRLGEVDARLAAQIGEVAGLVRQVAGAVGVLVRHHHTHDAA
jgi:hypothetical protein